MMEKKYPEYLRVAIPAKEEYEVLLDMLMEEGLVPGIETTDTALIAWILRDGSEELIARLRKELPPQHLDISVIPGQDWNQRWKENFSPLRIGKKFWVAPPWDLPELQAGQHCIVIQPGQAFGTGTHESTQLALEILEKHFRGGSLYDIGCGSGILAIAAAKLGAYPVNAFDYDELFLENMAENLALNQISNIEYYVADALKMQRSNADWLLINIEKRVILPLLDHFEKIGENPTRMLLSGLLTTDLPQVKNALKEKGFQLIESKEKGEWSAILAMKNEDK